MIQHTKKHGTKFGHIIYGPGGQLSEARREAASFDEEMKASQPRLPIIGVVIMYVLEYL